MTPGQYVTDWGSILNVKKRLPPFLTTPPRIKNDPVENWSPMTGLNLMLDNDPLVLKFTFCKRFSNAMYTIYAYRLVAVGSKFNVEK